MAAGRIQGSAVPFEDPGARVAALVSRHESTLLRVARQASLCHDDALDAYQRALEIFVRRLDAVDPATELAWLKVVVRHEALAIRRARSESVAGEPVDFDAVVPTPERTVEDQIAAGERVRRSAEALRALKPDEAQALMMKAHGLSYEEIGKRNGWTYTKVNRAITEGRRRFMRVYAGIESGEECERFAPIVEALAAGSATSAQVLEIRPHLRHCTACRAAVRDLHLSRTRRASLFWPLFAVVEPLRGLFERSSGEMHSHADTLADSLAGLGDTPIAEDLPSLDDSPFPDRLVENLLSPEALRVNPNLPTNTSTDADFVQAPTEMADVAAGVSDVDLGVPSRPQELIEAADRIARLKHDVLALLHRANASDVAVGVHLTTSSGGGRLTTIATVLGLCLSSVGAGTVCVVSGIVPAPDAIFRQERDSSQTRPAVVARHARSSDPGASAERHLSRSLSESQTANRSDAGSRKTPASPRGTTPRRASRHRSAGQTPAGAVQNEFGFDATPSPEADPARNTSSTPSTPPPRAVSSASARTVPSPDPVGEEFDAVQQEFRP